MTPNLQSNRVGNGNTHKNMAPQATPPLQPQAERAAPRLVGAIPLYHSLDEDFSVYAPSRFIDRFFATCIDYLVFGTLVTLLKLPFLRILDRLEVTEQLSKVQAIHSFLFLLGFVMYQIVPHVLWGQTLGKTFFGIRVVTLQNSEKVTVMQILKRELFGKLLSAMIMGLGFTMMIWRADKRTLHDVMCETKVVKFRR